MAPAGYFGTACPVIVGRIMTSVTMDPRVARLRLAIFFVSFPFGILMFALPLIGRDLGASAIQIGGLFSVFALVLVVVRPLVGRGLDRYGRRPFLIAGLLGYALANGLYAWSMSVAGLYAARLAQGIGSGLMWLSAYAIVADLAPAGRRGTGYGGVDEMGARGALVGTFVAFTVLGFLSRGQMAGSVERYWSTLFLVFTVVTLAGVAIAWRGVPETLPRAARSAAPDDAPTVPRPAWRWPPQLRTLMGIVLLTASASSLLSPILIVYLRDHISSDVSQLAWAYLPAAIAAAILPSRFGHLSDRYGRRRPIALALCVAAGVSLLIPVMHSLVPLALIWLAEAAAFAAATPAEEALVADISGGDQQGTTFGYYTAAASLGAVIGPLLGGFMYDTFAAEWAFRTNALLLALGAALVLLLIREPARQAGAATPQA